MKVWILVECMNQSDYTDSCEIKGVYSSPLKAQEEKERLEALSKQEQEEFDTDHCYYEVLPYTVE